MKRALSSSDLTNPLVTVPDEPLRPPLPQANLQGQGNAPQMRQLIAAPGQAAGPPNLAAVGFRANQTVVPNHGLHAPHQTLSANNYPIVVSRLGQSEQAGHALRYLPATGLGVAVQNLVHISTDQQQMHPAYKQAWARKDYAACLSMVRVMPSLLGLKGNAEKTLLIDLAEIGDAKMVLALLNCVPEPSRQALAEIATPEGDTALTIAALLGQAEVTKALLKAVPNPQQLAQMQRNDWFTALMIAAQQGHAEVTEALIKGVSGASRQQLAEMVLSTGETALMIAACEGHGAVVTALLNGVENPDVLMLQQNCAGNSAMRIAVMLNRREAAFALVQGVQNPIEMLNLKGPGQLTTLELAIQMGFSGLEEAAGLEEAERF